MGEPVFKMPLNLFRSDGGTPAVYISCTMSTRNILPIVATFKVKRQDSLSDAHALDRTFAHHQLTFASDLARQRLVDFIKKKADGSKAPIRPLGPSEVAAQP